MVRFNNKAIQFKNKPAGYTKNKFRVIAGVIIVSLFLTCKSNSSLFELIPAAKTGIRFNNKIVENDTINPFDVTNIYNGAGVGIGDFNNDGLQDIYFAGNQVSGKLYLNDGDFEFRDVTTEAGVSGEGKWCRGVSVTDINYDGLPDIYISVTLMDYPELRKNILYVNQGTRDGLPHFKEMAREYGLDDDSYSTMSYFFDYDNDGDPDLYIVVNDVVPEDNPSEYRPIVKDGTGRSTGRLYRNDFDSSLKHPVFTNVTKEAGVTIEGYGHSASITDINMDGWKDILVANDFLSNDLVYINNHDGTFTDHAKEYFKHTSANGMGQDAIDINNDGLTDIIEMDMDPEDNLRKKVLMSGYNYQNYNNNETFGYQYQYVRNSLQLNLGPRIASDSVGAPVFAETGLLAGISSTDWSWAPVVQDFDNDGFRDLVVTNGFPKDLTDHDFIAFRAKSFARETKKETLSKIPQVKINNYAFRNKGDGVFENVSSNWGMNQPSFSNGAAYADLDNDGDLDVVISNINDEAFIYRNNNDLNESRHFLDISLDGPPKNRTGVGAWVYLYTKGKMQALEQSPYRGYLSTMTTVLHFGVGNDEIDSIKVVWPDGNKQVLKEVAANKMLHVKYSDARQVHEWRPVTSARRLFSDVTKERIRFVHEENDFVDFNIQKLIPHKLSEYPPGLAAGDLNNDGFDDIVVGGSKGKATTILLQKASGKFVAQHVQRDTAGKKGEDLGITLIDADNDADLDLYIVSGSNESEPGSADYMDQLYLNDGNANFTLVKNGLPLNLSSKSCARVADYDHDGDMDLFIAGRLQPWNYPNSAASFIYRNDSKGKTVKFTDVTKTIAPGLQNAGMVCDAVWCDFDNDGWQDLVFAGEMMPFTRLKNDNGKSFSKIDDPRTDSLKGSWSSIAPADLDNDGDVDFIVGNLGVNSFYSRAGVLSVYANDFYNQGTTQCVTTRMILDKPGGVQKEFTVHNRDDVVEQLPFIKKRFLTYADFASATFDKIFTPQELGRSKKHSANYFYTAVFVNEGGRYSLKTLPQLVQYSMINGIVVDDFNGDGNSDLCFNTNDYSGDPSNGRNDALNGLVLLGDGRLNFKVQAVHESGIFIPGNGKALVKLRSSDGGYLLAASENRGPLRLFRLNDKRKLITYEPGEVAADIHYKDGTKKHVALTNGYSFLSQSATVMPVDKDVIYITFVDARGNKREVNLRTMESAR